MFFKKLIWSAKLHRICIEPLANCPKNSQFQLRQEKTKKIHQLPIVFIKVQFKCRYRLFFNAKVHLMLCRFQKASYVCIRSMEKRWKHFPKLFLNESHFVGFVIVFPFISRGKSVSARWTLCESACIRCVYTKWWCINMCCVVSCSIAVVMHCSRHAISFVSLSHWLSTRCIVYSNFFLSSIRITIELYIPKIRKHWNTTAEKKIGCYKQQVHTVKSSHSWYILRRSLMLLAFTDDDFGKQSYLSVLSNFRFFISLFSNF